MFPVKEIPSLKSFRFLVGFSELKFIIFEEEHVLLRWTKREAFRVLQLLQLFDTSVGITGDPGDP